MCISITYIYIIVLYSNNTQYYTVFTTLHYTTLHYITLHCTTLHCTIPYYIAQCYPHTTYHKYLTILHYNNSHRCAFHSKFSVVFFSAV